VNSYLLLRNEPRTQLPPEFRADDVRYPESLVETFLKEYTREGDTVLDPFAGFGTTLLVAEAMGRVPFGVEYDRARCEYARGPLRNGSWLFHGDARQLASLELPAIDFSITSPPYMNWDDPEDPLTGYSTRGGGYGQYLSDMRSIYCQMAGIMNEGARAVIEVANLKRSGVTTLAWDIAGEVAKELTFEGEVVVCWEPTYGYGYDHSYCLVFRKEERPTAPTG
jgi:hypothetical protein